MKDRIIAFLEAINLGSSQFAGEIGVQPSGISHILSGRNNPSLDFVLKVLNRYPELSSEWLLFGRGDMFRNSGSHEDEESGGLSRNEVRSEMTPEYRRDLFAGVDTSVTVGGSEVQGGEIKGGQLPHGRDQHDKGASSDYFMRDDDSITSVSSGIGADRMILVYGDGTFEQFKLRRGNSENPVPE